MKNRFAFVVTVNQKYLYGVNANINAQEHAGTKADFELVHGYVEPKYIDGCRSAFDCAVVWTAMEKYKQGNYFSCKYHRALELEGIYDALCIIDADLFMYTNVNEYFELAASGEKLTTAKNIRYNGMNRWVWGDQAAIRWGKPDWELADFPVFFSPKHHKKVLEDWIKFHEASVPENMDRLASHPCGSFNRSVCKNLTLDKLKILNGSYWVTDKDYTLNNYEARDGKMIYTLGPKEQLDPNDSQIYALHNRWWMAGRVWAELHNMTEETRNHAAKNMNVIKLFMDRFAYRKLGEFITDSKKGKVDE